MATTKRKREVAKDSDLTTSKRIAIEENDVVLQVVCGSYERVLHGFTVSIPRVNISKSTTDPADRESTLSFSDTFLFNAHASAIRCLALAPASDATPQQKSRRILATGSTDERINVYQLSTTAPSVASRHKQSTLLPMPSLEAPRNKEIGTLMHHSSAVTALHFASRGKLLSASMDNTISISRTKDWMVLSNIKAPIPKSAGRPSGDTFAPGEVPAGINSIAVHPSAKLMLSVGQGEKCMRLWNLLTGKKAGVLTYDKKLLHQIGEARYRGGEAREVSWAPDGEEFVVVFERGLLVYGLDCKVRAVVGLGFRTKLCKVRYLPAQTGMRENAVESKDEEEEKVLAVSTEDGRILFYNTSHHKDTDTPGDDISRLIPVGQVGQQQLGNRIKDFVVLQITNGLLFITASSSGNVSILFLDSKDLSTLNTRAEDSQDQKVRQFGVLLGSLETTRRITCLTAFVMDASVQLSGVKQADKVNGYGNGIQVGADNANDSDEDENENGLEPEEDEDDDSFEGFDED